MQISGVDLDKRFLDKSSDLSPLSSDIVESSVLMQLLNKINVFKLERFLESISSDWEQLRSFNRNKKPSITNI